MFVAAAGASAATQAPPGTFVALAGASAATPAAPGYYDPGFGNTAPIIDPLGTYTNAPAATAPTLAPLGTFVDTTGATAPTEAAPGTFVDTTGATAATRAPPGTYVANAGATTATIDPLGSYTNVAGATAAILAPPGTYVGTTGATAPTAAPPGFYDPGFGNTAPIPIPVNAPPVIRAPASATVQVGEATKIADVSISDADAVSAHETVTVSLVDAGGLLSANTGAFDGGGTITGVGTTHLTIEGKLAQVNADLSTLTDLERSSAESDHDDDDENDDWGDSGERFGSNRGDDEEGSSRHSPTDKITINASDSRGANAVPQSIAVNVNAPPVISAPDSITVQQGHALRIDEVGVSDVDAASVNERITVSLTDSYGLLSATPHAAGGGGTISGDSTTRLTIAGTLAQVNADLTTLTDKETSSKPDKIVVNASDDRGGSALPQTILVSVGDDESEDEKESGRSGAGTQAICPSQYNGLLLPNPGLLANYMASAFIPAGYQGQFRTGSEADNSSFLAQPIGSHPQA
jgi:hypothetical protein